MFLQLVAISSSWTERLRQISGMNPGVLWLITERSTDLCGAVSNYNKHSTQPNTKNAADSIREGLLCDPLTDATERWLVRLSGKMLA